MPRIVYLSYPATEISGGIKVIFQHASLLGAAGHQVTVLAEGERPSWTELAAGYHDLRRGRPSLPRQDLVIATYWTTLATARALDLGPLAHFCQGYEGGLALLKKRPQAVFIANYLMAVGFMKAMRQYQLRCPADIAIVTCDDHPWLESFSPRLTTVNFPKYELGSEAARVLIDRIADREAPPQRVELRSALTIRESCGYNLRAVALA